MTHNVTIRKLGKKGQFVCDLVKKSEGGGHVSSFERRVSISKGGHVSSVERGGPLAWGVHWHGGGGSRVAEGWGVAFHTYGVKMEKGRVPQEGQLAMSW